MKQRIAVIDREKCHPQECGNYLCAKLCPVNRTGSDCVTPGDDSKARIDEILCTGCGICPQRCPFGAITIINLPSSLTDSIHRYGKNQFELFSLPTPLFGKTVGVIGKNGIGKSTVMKILAGIIKPNLGKFDEETTMDDLVKRFRGNQIQRFLEQLRDGKVDLAYKPQKVDLIPHKFSGTVKTLLETVDTTGRIDDIVEQLQLTKILDLDIKKISGGELQRVAIGATLLKSSNVFFFDEPTSYLDIKQRIQIAKLINGLPDGKSASMVIDHDLIVLDYMTDLINVMYGHESVYGVSSGVKANREGINQYLDGFLKEENMKFRNSALKFEKYIKKIAGQKVSLVSWKDFSQELGKFSLTGSSGELFKHEVVGVLGENGIGKTTFVKMLAGEIQSSAFGGKVSVAYKPQYLDISDDVTVAEFLREAMQYQNQIITPLDLQKLYTKKLSTLSGGELQKVMVAKVLGEDAELLLLDEPSAYLDVEQRLIVAKVIRSIIEERECTALIVDHDFMFLDALADRVVVFTGQPAVEGKIEGPYELHDGVNKFLKTLDITMRRDDRSHRPRINKPGSVKDREQKSENKWYY